MRQEVAKKLTTALRSGQYIQGKLSLAAVDPDDGIRKHCCLGVLCEVAAQEDVIPPGEDVKTPGGYFETKYGDENGYNTATLPETVQNWADMDSDNGTMRNVPEMRRSFGFGAFSLTTLNDDGLNFNEIADIIDRFYEEL